MHKILFSLMFFSMFCLSCSKDTASVNGAVTVDISKAIHIGSFTSGVHATSGKVYVIKNSENSYTLQLQDYKTDDGPDVHLYLASDKNAKDYIDVLSKSKNGTFTIDVNQAIDFTKYKYVLAWCESFSVLFGSAELK
jgi:Electron transfer DM13